jgi:uroporphyrinogen decarboxylase
MLTHKERLQACIHDDTALDRPPVALWRHFPVDDQAPDSLAAATLEFQDRYDFDLVKVTPASSFCLKGWGAVDTWEGSTEGTRRYTKHLIENPRDWERLRPLDPHKDPYLNGQLTCLQRIRETLDPETPVLQTIFSPLAQAKNLSGEQLLMAHLRLHPEAVLKALETITQTTRLFVLACVDLHIEGVFYAIQQAQADLLTLSEYETFGSPFDLRILQETSSLWCNMLHLHGINIYPQLMAKYPCQIVNWHDRETAPSLSEARQAFPGILCGGISQNSMVFDTPERLQEQSLDACEQTGGKKFILGTGCVVPIIAPHGNLIAVRKSVEGRA